MEESGPLGVGFVTAPRPGRPPGRLDLKVIRDAFDAVDLTCKFFRAALLIRGLNHAAQMHDTLLCIDVHTGEIRDPVGREFTLHRRGDRRIIHGLHGLRIRFPCRSLACDKQTDTAQRQGEH